MAEHRGAESECLSFDSFGEFRCFFFPPSLPCFLLVHRDACIYSIVLFLIMFVCQHLWPAEPKGSGGKSYIKYLHNHISEKNLGPCGPEYFSGLIFSTT